MSYYLYVKRFAPWGVVLFLVVYDTLEGGFLVANLAKMPMADDLSLLISGVIISVMSSGTTRSILNKPDRIRKTGQVHRRFESLKHRFYRQYATTFSVYVRYFAAHRNRI